MKKISKEMILAMPAGREMDDLVAGLVMGWQRRTFKSDGVDFWHIPGTAGCELDAPHFSTSIAVAWDVINHMITYHRKRPKISRVSENEWCVSMDHPSLENPEVYCDLICVAICRAALLAVLDLN